MKRAATLIIMMTAMSFWMPGTAFATPASDTGNHAALQLTEELQNCNRILNSGSDKPLLAFIRMFTDYVPIVLEHPDDSAAKRFAKFSGRYGMLAFLTRQPNGEYEVVVGNPSEKMEAGKRVVITQIDGHVIRIPLESIFAFTAKDTQNRTIFFNHTFPVAHTGHQNSWKSNRYVQTLFAEAVSAPKGDVNLQKRINKYFRWLNSLAKRNKQLAVLVREAPSRGEVLLIGVVVPVLSQVNGYSAIEALDIKSPSGLVTRYSIAHSQYATGVIMMTNDPISKLTAKTESQLQYDFNKLQLR